MGKGETRRQRIFDAHSEVLEEATIAGVAYGFIKKLQGGVESQHEVDHFFETYELFEAVSQGLIKEKDRETVRTMMREFFDDAARDETLLSHMTADAAAEIYWYLVHDRELALKLLRTK